MKKKEEDVGGGGVAGKGTIRTGGTKKEVPGIRGGKAGNGKGKSLPQKHIQGGILGKLVDETCQDWTGRRRDKKGEDLLRERGKTFKRERRGSGGEKRGRKRT